MKRVRYTPEQLEFLRTGYATMAIRQLTPAFNEKFGTSKTEGQIKATLCNHRITSGRTGCFEKGRTSWNRGVKGYMGANRTSFKKGRVPPNRKPLETERICKRDGFILIKVAEANPHTGFPTRYKHKHVHVWEQAHGPVPKGQIVSFLDGDKLNCALDNLMLLTRTELLCLNMHNYRETPAELKPSVLALAKLEAKAGIRTNAGQGRKKNG
jgi:hypothetical protein